MALKSLPVSDFDLYGERQRNAEQKAASMHAQILQWQHERRMRELETSVHTDSRSEEQAYYSALAQLQLYKLEKMMRR
jgi:hypothetical protein